MTDRIEELESAREFDQELIQKLLDDNRILKKENEAYRASQTESQDKERLSASQRREITSEHNTIISRDLDSLEIPEQTVSQRDAYLRERSQEADNLNTTPSESDIIKAIKLSDLSDSSKQKFSELIAIRDISPVRIEIAKTNELAQRIHEAADVSHVDENQYISSMIEGSEKSVGLLKDLKRCNLSREYKMELAASQQHLTNKGLAHEPRPFAPDYKAPAEPAALREARVKSIVDHYKPVSEKETKTQRIDTNRPRL